MEDTYGGELEQVVVSDGDLASPALPHDGDDAPVAPKRGSLAWLQAQEHTEVMGERVPACHRIPSDATLAARSDSRFCRVVSASGDRCKGTRLLAYGLCMGHAGGGGTSDLDAMRERSAAKQRSLKLTRQLLAIGPRRAGDPRAAVRLRSAQRAADFAAAIVDGPLDADLPPLAKQAAALKALDAGFPLQTASLTVELSDPDSIDWHDLEALASSLES